MTPNKKCVEEAIKIFTHGSGASKNPVDSFLVAKDMLKQLGKAYLSGELGEIERYRSALEKIVKTYTGDCHCADTATNALKELK